MRETKRKAPAPCRVLGLRGDIVGKTISETVHTFIYANRNSSPSQDIWRNKLAGGVA